MVIVAVAVAAVADSTAGGHKFLLDVLEKAFLANLRDQNVVGASKLPDDVRHHVNLPWIIILFEKDVRCEPLASAASSFSSSEQQIVLLFLLLVEIMGVRLVLPGLWIRI